MTEVPSTDYQPIENYGVIGDLHTIALVGMDGSIDFMSFPHFDSPTVFAALLDRQRGGRFQIAPVLCGCAAEATVSPRLQHPLNAFSVARGGGRDLGFYAHTRQ